MNWLEWSKDSEEIRETNGMAETVVGYATTTEEAEEVASDLGMRIAIPSWCRNRVEFIT